MSQPPNKFVVVHMYSVLRLLHYPHNIHYSRYILCPYKSGLSVTSDEDCCCRCVERSTEISDQGDTLYSPWSLVRVKIIFT